MTDLALTRCRSCGASILFATTPKGKQMLLDAEPQRLVVLEPSVLPGEPLTSVAVVRSCFTPHFATCPTAAAHRKPKETSAR
jgi:hypothetical protein